MGIFFDDWQACLRSHYIYVIPLRHVLHQTGITEEELAALQAEGLTGRPLPESASAASHAAEGQDEESVAAEPAPFDEETTLGAEGDDSPDEPPPVPPGQLALF